MGTTAIPAALSQQRGCRWCEVSSDGFLSTSEPCVGSAPGASLSPIRLCVLAAPGCSHPSCLSSLRASPGPEPPCALPSRRGRSPTRALGGLGFWALLAQTSLSGGSGVLPHQGEPRPTQNFSLAASRSARGPSSGPLSGLHVTGVTRVPYLPVRAMEQESHPLPRHQEGLFTWPAGLTCWLVSHLLVLICPVPFQHRLQAEEKRHQLCHGPRLSVLRLLQQHQPLLRAAPHRAQHQRLRHQGEPGEPLHWEPPDHHRAPPEDPGQRRAGGM